MQMCATEESEMAQVASEAREHVENLTKRRRAQGSRDGGLHL